MTKRIIHLLLTLTLLVPAFASAPGHRDGQRQMKTIREQLKNQKGGDALKGVVSLRKDSLYTWNPQLLQYGVEACKLLNDKENEKLYLKSNPDTSAFFRTLYDVYAYALLTDSAERCAAWARSASADEDRATFGAHKFRFRKQNRELLTRYYRNLSAAPRYFAMHGMQDEAQRFSALAIDVTQADMMGRVKSPVATDARLRELAVLHVKACYRQRHHADIERYASLALSDTASRESVIEMLAYAETERGDSLTYAERLKLGHGEYPSNMFFFSRLVDLYLRAGINDSVLVTANSTLESVLEMAQEDAALCSIDASNDYGQPSDAHALDGVRESVSLPDDAIAQIFEAKAIAYHNNGNAQGCIDEAYNILNWNPQHPRADFYIGVSYYRMAEEVSIPMLVTDPAYKAATQERNHLLAQGRPHLEAYRRAMPADSASWAPLLYETYLYLNLGPEFEEISRFIH